MVVYPTMQDSEITISSPQATYRYQTGEKTSQMQCARGAIFLIASRVTRQSYRTRTQFDCPRDSAHQKCEAHKLEEPRSCCGDNPTSGAKSGAPKNSQPFSSGTSTQALLAQDLRPSSASWTPFAPCRRVHGNGSSRTTWRRNISHCTLNALS